MHKLFLNELLNNSCSSPSDIEGWNEYRIELCCAEYIITARHVGDGEYEVLKMHTPKHSCKTGGRDGLDPVFPLCQMCTDPADIVCRVTPDSPGLYVCNRCHKGEGFRYITNCYDHHSAT